MDACQLADKFTTAELLERMKKIKENPKNQLTGFYLYTPAARRKMAAITWAITYHMQEERRARGEPGGYGEFS
jgi:hypothetical protein